MPNDRRPPTETVQRPPKAGSGSNPRGPDTPPGNPDPAREPGPGDAPLWRSRRLWHPIGYVATALWLAGVLFVTGGDTRQPLFDYIFVVPLGFWIGGLIVAAVIKRILARRDTG